MSIPKEQNWLYLIRRRLGLSRKQMGKLIGLSATTISDIENDLSLGYSMRTFDRLDVFDLSYDIITNLQSVPEDYFDDEYFNQLRKRLGLEDQHGKV